MSSNTMISFRPQNAIRHLPWQLDSKAALGFLLILATFSLVGWLYLTQASAVTATSYRIDELRLELDQVKNQNATLTLEIARLEALSRVETRAHELGFQPATNIQYLPVTNYPVLLETQEFLGEPERIESSIDAYVVDSENSSWWLKKLDTLAAWVER
jgi:hypothetical protein